MSRSSLFLSSERFKDSEEDEDLREGEIDSKDEDSIDFLLIFFTYRRLSLLL